MRFKLGIFTVLSATFLAPTMATAAEEPSEQVKRNRSEAQSEPGLESKDIQVTLTADMVQLSGSVVSAEDRDKGVRIARSYAGDREVQDHLIIQTP